MFDFGLSFSHIVVIVLLAVIVIGPKDLPIVLRRFGQFMNKMRGMARDFQSHVDVAMKDAGMDGIRQDLQSLKSGMTTAMNPVQSALSGAATSLMDGGAKPQGEAAAAPAAPVMMASLPVLAPANDFSRIFNATSTGETRVQGRALDEA